MHGMNGVFINEDLGSRSHCFCGDVVLPVVTALHVMAHSMIIDAMMPGSGGMDNQQGQIIQWSSATNPSQSAFLIAR